MTNYDFSKYMIPDRFKRIYDVLNTLGKGSYGTVVEVLSKTEQQRYAVKIIPFDIEDKGAVKLWREVQSLAKAERSSNVVGYYYCWIEDHDGVLEESDEEDCIEQMKIKCPVSSLPNVGTMHTGLTSVNSSRQRSESENVTHDMYIKMELCEKGSLADVMQKELGKNRNEDELEQLHADNLELFRQIVDGMNHIHSSGLMHRDLKPNNILISDDGTIKICDFGLTRPVQVTTDGESKEHVKERENTAGIGTDFYMAPEQKGNDQYGPEVDVYACGLILARLLIPFSTDQEQYEELDRLKKNGFEASPMLQQFKNSNSKKCVIIERMIRKDPLQRPSFNEIKEIFLPPLMPIKASEEYLTKAFRKITKNFTEGNERSDEMNKRIQETNNKIDEMKTDINTKFGEMETNINTKFGEIKTDINKLVEYIGTLQNNNITGSSRGEEKGLGKNGDI